MLLQFPSSVDAHVYSIGTLLDEQTGRPHKDQSMACQKYSIGFPEEARPLCELDGMVGAHDVGGLLTKKAQSEGALCVRATRPFFDPSSNPSHCWMAISRVQLVGTETDEISQENLFSSSVIINARLWERHAADLILNLNNIPFIEPDYFYEGSNNNNAINRLALEPGNSPHIELKDLPLGVGLILGALASGYPGYFGTESFKTVDEFLLALSHTFKLLPAALRHTISFSYGFEHSQPICALQYFPERIIKEGAFMKPVAAMPNGATPHCTTQHVRGLLAERLKNYYAPHMQLNELDEFEDNDDLFEEEGLYEELTGLARETSAALGQVLNEIGIQLRINASSVKEGVELTDKRLIAYESLLKGEDTTPLVTDLYTLFSDFDSAPDIYSELMAQIDTNFKPEIYALSTCLGAAIRDEKFAIEQEDILTQLEDLLCLACRLPVAEPFLEYRTRIIEGVADGLRQYVGNRVYLTPSELVTLSEYEQLSDMVACILETGDWSFTQALNISFTIFALSGDGYIQDAAALARRLLPPSVVSHQWVHALINSRALAEAFEAIIMSPDLLHADQVLTILNAMTEHLARTGRKEIVLDHVTRLSMSLPSQEEVDLTSDNSQKPLDEGLMLRLRMMTILSDSAERFHASAQHARLILSR